MFSAKMASEKLRAHGVVGAGGAGFPTHVKAQSQVEFVIANGAECEPLIHKDAEIMKHFPAEIVSGMDLMMQSTGAATGKFGIKSKNADSADALKRHITNDRVEFTMLGDFYPSGDEYELVYTATGRLIPPAGIPLQVGCVVSNVETLYNVHQAAQDKPVTETFLSICGAVREAEIVLGPGRHALPRPDRRCRRRDGERFRDLRQRHHDGHAELRSRRRGDQNHRRLDRAAARSLPDDAAHAIHSRRCTRSENRLATSAATAPSFARATCWDTTFSRTK